MFGRVSGYRDFLFLSFFGNRDFFEAEASVLFFGNHSVTTINFILSWKGLELLDLPVAASS